VGSIVITPKATWRLRSRAVMNHGLEPAPPFESHEGNEGAGQDQSKPERIAPRPVELRHELEIHTLAAGYQRRWDPTTDAMVNTLNRSFCSIVMCFCQVGQRSGLWQDLGHGHNVLPVPRLKSSTKPSGCINASA
jgi:hypothetical protein